MANHKNEYLTPEEMGELLKVHPKTLIKWRRLRKGPRYVTLAPRCIRYFPPRSDGTFERIDAL